GKGDPVRGPCAGPAACTLRRGGGSQPGPARIRPRPLGGGAINSRRGAGRNGSAELRCAAARGDPGMAAHSADRRSGPGAGGRRTRLQGRRGRRSAGRCGDARAILDAGRRRDPSRRRAWPPPVRPRVRPHPGRSTDPLAGRRAGGTVGAGTADPTQPRRPPWLGASDVPWPQLVGYDCAVGGRDL
ncbi:MAG: hypothetical protein AVDCRST_MAG09-1543, partial [uncultured Sphingomonas sp.]